MCLCSPDDETIDALVAAVDSAAQSIEDFVAGGSATLELTRPPESTQPQASTDSTPTPIILKPVPDDIFPVNESQSTVELTTVVPEQTTSIMNYGDYSDDYLVEDPDWPGIREIKFIFYYQIFQYF